MEETEIKQELELLEKARLKDTRAFSRLVELYQERAIHAAYAFIGNFEDARDISQEAFVKAYEKLDGFKAESRFYTWFYRILANACKDFLRKKKVRRHLSFWLGPAEEGDLDPMESLAKTTRTASDDASDHEIEGALFAALEKLPYRQRLAFCLRYLDGLTMQEIALAMEITVGAVKANIWQAAQKLRGYLGYLVDEAA